MPTRDRAASPSGKPGRSQKLTTTRPRIKDQRRHPREPRRHRQSRSMRNDYNTCRRAAYQTPPLRRSLCAHSTVRCLDRVPDEKRSAPSFSPVLIDARLESVDGMEDPVATTAEMAPGFLRHSLWVKAGSHRISRSATGDGFYSIDMLIPDGDCNSG